MARARQPAHAEGEEGSEVCQLWDHTRPRLAPGIWSRGVLEGSQEVGWLLQPKSVGVTGVKHAPCLPLCSTMGGERESGLGISVEIADTFNGALLFNLLI